MRICCLNPNCQNPQNPDSNNFGFSCGTKLVPVLRGRYRPVEFLGRGGFGRTYRAVDSDRMGASCVIKQFAPQSQGSTFQEAARLFNREAEQLLNLGQHAQIPTLFAYFESELQRQGN